MKNYWKMRDFSMFTVSYAYVDHSSYQADRLFEQNKVKMKFGGIYEKGDSPYCVVFCKVRKKDAERFEEVLEKHNNKLLLLGYRDYPDACKEIEKMIKGELEKR